MEIKLNESQIDDLVKLALSEERKKLISENWTRDSDANGYWKILYDTLKKGGIPVKLQYANDPAKSTFMWWGTWVINKDLTKNGGYPISFTTPARNNLFFKFRENGNKYAGQPFDKILLDSECTNYYYRMNHSIFKGDQKTTFKKLANDMSEQGKTVPFQCIASRFTIKAEKLIEDGKETRKERQNAWDTLIGPFLEKNKPSNATFDNNEAIKSYTYSTGRKLMFYKSGGVYYPDKGIKGNYPTRYADWEWDNKKGILLITNTKGQKLDIGQVIYDPYSIFLADDPWINLKKAIEKYKPPTTKLSTSTNDDVYIVKYEGNVQLEFHKNGTIWFSSGKGKVTDNGGRWSGFLMKNGILDKGTLTNNKGVYITLAYGLQQADSNFGKKITKITPESDYPYGQLKRTPTPELIAYVLMDANNAYDDDEAYAEAAFNQIKNKDMYDRVAKELGTLMGQSKAYDPYTWVKSFMDPNPTYNPVGNSFSIDFMMDQINKNKGNDYYLVSNMTIEQYNKECALVLTDENPQGEGRTNGAGLIPFDLWNGGTPKDPNISVKWRIGNEIRYKGNVPSDFGWKFNNNIYPFPKPYSLKCIENSQKIANKLKESVSRINEDNKPISNGGYSWSNNMTKTVPDAKPEVGNTYVRTSDSKETIVLGYEQQARKNLLQVYQKMTTFNNSLIRQKELIPQYCTTPLERQGKAGTRSEPIYAYLSMYTLCKDFGGLWVYGSNTSKFMCGCRDSKAIDLNIEVEQDGYYTVKTSELIAGQQGSTNWSHTDNTNLAVSVVAFASAFIPVVGPFISAGISLANAAKSYQNGNHKAAAVEFVFALLPLAGSIPKIGRITEKMANSIAVKLVFGNKPFTVSEYKTMKAIIEYDTYISTKLAPQIEKLGLSKFGTKTVKTLVKKAEAKVLSLTGAPTYGDVKKKATEETVATFGVEDKETA